MPLSAFLDFPHQSPTRTYFFKDVMLDMFDFKTCVFSMAFAR